MIEEEEEKNYKFDWQTQKLKLHRNMVELVDVIDDWMDEWLDGWMDGRDEVAR